MHYYSKKRNKKGRGNLPLKGLILSIPLVIIIIFQTGQAAEQVATPELFQTKPAPQTTSLTGYTRAKQVMDLISKEAGYCLSVSGDIGDVIGDDAVFARLDTTFIDLSITKNKILQQQLQDRIDYYQKEVDRHANLLQKNLSNRSTLDRLTNRLQEAKHELRIQKVEGTNLLERKKRFTIRARPGWRIIKRNIQPGEWIVPGKLLGSAANYQTLLVPYALTSREFRAVMENKGHLHLFLPELGSNGTKVQATLENVWPQFDPETRKTKIELAIREANFDHRGGLRTELKINLPDPGGAVLVPKSALLKSYEEYRLVKKNGKQVPVVLMGEGPDNTYKVKAPQVKPGQQYKLSP